MAPAFAIVKEYATSYFFPLFLYVLGVYYFLRVFVRTLFQKPIELLSPSTVAGQSFGEAWAALDEGDPYEGPLRHILPALGTASGKILEIGPGSGEQVRFLTNPKVEMVYGVEPCKVLHEPLSKAILAAGLQEKYRILDCGAERKSLSEGLRRAGLLKDNKSGEYEGSPLFDTIIVIRVLCSVNNPVDTVDFLYQLLKPGGRLLVGEHIQNPWRKSTGSVLGRFTQVLYQLAGWSFFMGNCHLDRKTDEYLETVGNKYGGWGKVELKAVGEFAPIPFVFGELVKRK
ncbi:hypothetical protein NHQ30_005575 [Ciborinia camelliae]|nr:hypothetical protein NHQ30_005575 [Ciborinia camelliae]